MKSQSVLSVLLLLISSLVDAAALAAEVCLPKQQSKLSSCATGAQFCTSLLGYSAGSSHTLTLAAETTKTVTFTKTHFVHSTTEFYTTILYGISSTSTTTSTISVVSETITLPTGVSGGYTCYVSTLHEATPGVPNVMIAAATSCGFNNLATAALSTACSCYIDAHVTATNTVTKTKTVKATAVPIVTLTRYHTAIVSATASTTVAATTHTVNLPACSAPPSSCSNTGLQWAYFTALPGNGYPSNNPTFEIVGYKSQTPVVNGTTQILDIPATDGNGNGPIYGSSEPESSFFVNHKGYLYAPQTGVYAVRFTYVDDAAFMWFGSLAYSGWNRTNYNLYANWQTTTFTTFNLSLTQGQYMPMRVAMGQGGNAGGMTAEMYAPDGELLMGSDSGTASPYFVWHSCDGTTAPTFPVWGSET